MAQNFYFLLFVLFALPGLVTQCLGKFFVALFMQQIFGAKRISLATISTLACAFMPPIVYLLVTHGHVRNSESYVFQTVFAFFAISAIIDISILALFKKLEWKAIILCLIIDFMVVSLSPMSILLLDVQD